MSTRIFKNRDNEVTLSLYNDEILFPTSSITKIEFKNNSFSFNSVDSPEAFIIGSTSITLKIGLISVPKGVHYMTLIIYFADAPRGVVWDENIVLNSVNI